MGFLPGGDMSESEKATYETLLKDLREAKTAERNFHLDKIEKFISVVNIRINIAVPKGWELP
jgi:hypothetical protein